MASWGKGLSSLYSLPRVQVRLLGPCSPGVKRLPNSKHRVLAKFAEGHEIFSGLVGEVRWVIRCPVLVLPRNGGSEARCSSLPSHWVSGGGDSPARSHHVYRRARGTPRLHPPLPKPPLVVQQEQCRIPASGENCCKDLRAATPCTGLS